MDHNARPAQISPAIYSPAAQRSAVRSRTVRCRALRCGAVSCCAVLSFEHRAVPGIIRVVVMCYLSSFFFFYTMYAFNLIFHGPLFFPPRKLPPYCRSKRNTVKKSTHSTAEHNRATCSAQAALGIIKSLFAPDHGPPSFCPLYMFFVAFFLALRERSGRRQPPA